MLVTAFMSATPWYGVTVTLTLIIPVWLKHKDKPLVEVTVYALLDDASDTTSVQISTLTALGIQYLVQSH